MRRSLLLAFLSGLFVQQIAHAQPADSIWTHPYGGRDREFCSAVIQTNDGGFALAGYTTSFGAGESDTWLVITNEDGDSLWSQTYGGGNIEFANAMLGTDNGGFILAGGTISFGAGGRDFWLLETDVDSEELWSQTYGGGEEDICWNAIQTADGGYALVGETRSFGAGEEDF